jgi:hypothetical protein
VRAAARLLLEAPQKVSVGPKRGALCWGGPVQSIPRGQEHGRNHARWHAPQMKKHPSVLFWHDELGLGLMRSHFVCVRKSSPDHTTPHHTGEETHSSFCCCCCCRDLLVIVFSLAVFLLPLVVAVPVVVVPVVCKCHSSHE